MKGLRWKIFLSVSFLLTAMTSALRSTDLAAARNNAEEFRLAHPGKDPSTLSWGERILCREARDAFSIQQMRDPEIRASAISAGTRPCLRCGLVTASWCEGCRRDTEGVPPGALCTICDEHQLLCQKCISENKLYSEVRRDASDNTMEITGFNREDGSFETLDPPLHIDLTEIPMVDGTYDLNFIMSKINERQMADKAASGQTAGSQRQ